MLRQVLCRTQACRLVAMQQVRRNIGMTAVLAQKAPTDPIQKLFLDKVKEYAQKSKYVTSS